MYLCGPSRHRALIRHTSAITYISPSPDDLVSAIEDPETLRKIDYHRATNLREVLELLRQNQNVAIDQFAQLVSGTECSLRNELNQLIVTVLKNDVVVMDETRNEFVDMIVGIDDKR